MTSVGYTSPINGSNQAFRFLVVDPASSGGAIRGYMPNQTVDTDKTYVNFEQIRFSLKNAWNTSYRGQLKRSDIKQPIITPFRAVNNAGDLLSRNNYSCGGTCQSFQSRPNLRGLKQRFGANQSTCIPSDYYNYLQLDARIPAGACNVKYVYDSSDYTTYLKQRAVVRNYNDLSYGGDDYKASQSAQRAIRRY